MFREYTANYIKIAITIVLDLIFVTGICAVVYFRRTVYSSTVPFTSIMITLILLTLVSFMCYDFLYDKVVCFWYLWIYFVVFIVAAASYTVKCARMILQFHTNLIESKGDYQDSSSSSSSSSNISSSNGSNYLNSDNLILEEFTMIEDIIERDGREKRKNNETHAIGDRQHQFERMIQGIDDDVTTQWRMLKKQKLAHYMYSKRHWANTRNLIKIFLGIFCIFTTFPIIVNVITPQYYETPWESVCHEKSILEYTLLSVIFLFIITYFISTLSTIHKQSRVMFLKRHLIVIVSGWLFCLGLGTIIVVIQSVFETNLLLQHILEIAVLCMSIAPFYGEIVDPFIYHMKINRKKRKRKAIYDQIDGIEDVFDFDPHTIQTNTNTHSSNDTGDNTTDHNIMSLKRIKRRKKQHKRDKMIERQRDILKCGVKYLRYFILDTRFIDEDIKHQYQVRLDFIAKVFEYGEFAHYHQSMSSVNLLLFQRGNKNADDNSVYETSQQQQQPHHNNNACFKIGYIYKLWRLFFQDYYVVMRKTNPSPSSKNTLVGPLVSQQQFEINPPPPPVETKIDIHLDLKKDDSVSKSSKVSEKEISSDDVRDSRGMDVKDSDKHISSIALDRMERNHRRDMKRFHRGKILETESYVIRKNPIYPRNDRNPIGDLRVEDICYLYSLSSCDANVINERDMLRISHQFLRLYHENVSFINEEIFEDWKQSPYFYLFIERIIEHYH